MATKITLVDDIDQKTTQDVAQATFALQGRHYAIDLAPANLAKLEAALAPFIAVARQRSEQAVRAEKSGGRAAKASERAYDPGQLREWQAAQGRKVTTKGRFPLQDISDYLAAQK